MASLRSPIGAWVLAAVLTVVTVSGVFVAEAGDAGATQPVAGISINPAPGALAVTFVAQSSHFTVPVISSYRWKFGDGASAETSSRFVDHTYKMAGQFTVSVKEVNGNQTALAKGTLLLVRCPSGAVACAATLSVAGPLSLTVSGPINPAKPAGLDLFADPYAFANCGPQGSIERAVGVTDSGFVDPLDLTLSYLTANPTAARTTCFSSTIPFVDTPGQTVNSGPLPACLASHPTPPCVLTASVAVSQVDKELLIPPGDPKVGAG